MTNQSYPRPLSAPGLSMHIRPPLPIFAYTSADRPDLWPLPSWQGRMRTGRSPRCWGQWAIEPPRLSRRLLSV